VLLLVILLVAIVALVFLWPPFNKTWARSSVSHALSLLAAIGLGWFFMQIQGFGFAVGDPPYGTGEAIFDPDAIWFNATLYVLAVLYALRATIWMSARLFKALRGSNAHVPL
jgi:hypothetical protein